jgi:hypothetical protein
MLPRTELQTLLETVLGSGEVYFQPPSSVKMVYPCIIYERSDIRAKFADNEQYILDKEYTITVITKDPDSIIPDKVAKLQKCQMDRHFESEGLNHDVFIIYF